MVVMTRMTWTLFGLILMMVVSAAVMGAAATREEERAAASGAGAVGGEGHGARDTETGGAVETGAVGGDDRGVGHGACLEKSKASSMGGEDDSTFQDLPELSSGSRLMRIRQGTIFEIFKAERGHCRQSDEGTSPPVMEAEELGSEDDKDDTNFDKEAEVPGEEEDEEEQEVEAEEQPPQVHRGAKRRRIYEGMGIAGWSILQEDGPLEGYRHRPTAMRRFRTIHGGQVCIDGLK